MPGCRQPEPGTRLQTAGAWMTGCRQLEPWCQAADSRSVGARLQPVLGCQVADSSSIGARLQTVGAWVHDLVDLIVDHSPSRSLRSQGKDLLIVPRCKAQTASRELWIAVPSTWHDLPIHIGLSATPISFLSQLTTDTLLPHCVELTTSDLSCASDSVLPLRTLDF